MFDASKLVVFTTIECFNLDVKAARHTHAEEHAVNIDKTPAMQGSAQPHAATTTRQAQHFSQLKQRARDLRPYLREQARQTEMDRRVSEKTTDKLKALDLYRAVQPQRFGGFELGLDELQQLVFELGQGCTSTGWCYAIGAASSWLVSMFPAEAQEELWSGSPTDLAGGCIAPTGKARVVPGGFMLTGRWSFGSNCDNSAWMSLGAMVEGEGEVAQTMFMLVPAHQYQIIDQWNTMGLAGTGSKDILIEEEIFVPAHRTVSFSNVLEQDTPGSKINTSGLYRIPFLTGFPPLLATPAVAALRGAVDEFIETVAQRSTRGAFNGSGSKIAQFGHVQSAVAQADAAIDASQLILLRDLRAAAEITNMNEKVGMTRRIEYRRGHSYSLKLCIQAIDSLFEAVGGAGLSLDNGVQRAWRDVHAIAHHITVNWNVVSTMYGQMRLGLTPRGQF